ncbi:hypothetical protein QA601_10215 [Chitinispirillales bacterium ANBcel5]|uniref:hypothetical protein n=1 Tax=Cellulosispirillum alkaliphilum TaxID=3039283 RepID=UPI002A4F2FFC|nr:hypothetical protein [Chitinispirillales bacterium ANBcel5]
MSEDARGENEVDRANSAQDLEKQIEQIQEDLNELVSEVLKRKTVWIKKTISPKVLAIIALLFFLCFLEKLFGAKECNCSKRCR